jgi:26S proteasome non-ATPase regulatory subunit 9
MQREDLVVKFGGLRHPQSNLQALAAVVAENENKAIGVLVRRSGTDGLIALRLTPRQGWGGRGSLGCHLVPYASS